MSNMGINLFGTYLSLPEDAQRTQEALVRALDSDSKSQKCCAVGNMVKFMALSILNCPLYLADACVGGLLIMRPIERFLQQGASFCKSILFFFCGIYLLAGIIFHGDVYAQSQEERQAALEAQQQAAFEAQRKAEAISKFQSEFKYKLQTKLEDQLQKQLQERMQEHTSFLFKDSSYQELFKGLLQECLKDIHPGYLPSQHFEVSLHAYWYSSHQSFGLELPNNKEAMQELLIYWLGRRFLTLLRNSSQDLGQDMSQDLPEELRNSQIKWDHLVLDKDKIEKYLLQDLLLDFLPSLLQDKKDELQLLLTSESKDQLDSLGENLRQELISRLLQKLHRDAGETQHTARMRHECGIKDLLKNFFLSTKNDAPRVQPEGRCYPPLRSLIQDYFTTKIEPEIQGQFKPWFASRLRSRIQNVFPELSLDKQKWLQNQLQSWMQIPVSELCRIWETPRSTTLFQGLDREKSDLLQHLFCHLGRERINVLLRGRVQDLCQAPLMDRPKNLHHIKLYFRDSNRPRTAPTTPFGCCMDVVVGNNVLDECKVQDIILDLLPQLLQSRKAQLKDLALAQDPPQEWPQDLKEGLHRDLIDELRKRMLEDLGQASEVPITKQFTNLLEKVFLYVRDNPPPSAPPLDIPGSSHSSSTPRLYPTLGAC